MPASKAKALSSIFRSAVKSKSSSSSPAGDATLKHLVSSPDTSSPTAVISIFSKRSSVKSPKSSSRSRSSVLPRLRLEAASDSDGASARSSDLQGTDDEKSLKEVLNIPWFSNLSHNNTSVNRKEVSRERKQKWIFKSTQGNRFSRLITMCGQKLGTETTVQVFGKLGRETGLKEYNALIGLYIQRARTSNDEDIALEQIHKAFRIFESMREQGFQLEEETYGPFLMYLIDMGMVEEFHFFCEVIRKENTRSLSRLGYYEMLLWLGVNNEEKIHELCNYIAVDDRGDKSHLRENYLLALCESDRKEELLQLLEIVDITKLSPPDFVANIFKSLGRLLLESFAEKFLIAFKTCDCEAENISNFIFSYVVSIPNLAVEDVISKFKDFHVKLEVIPSSTSYKELITYCCDSHKVHAALDIVDKMCEVGMTLSIEVLHSILHASEESYDFNLVHRIYSVICHHGMMPTNETFRSMISLSVKMKDFEGAYGMLKDLEKFNLRPTSSMYNAIMAGYFREKNTYGVLMVIKQMELADVKPDSQTFSYLICNCDREEDIVKYYEELQHLGVQASKQIFMALINAYATCGQFEKAKQVVSDKGIPVKYLNEIKSVLVSALASHGQMSDALDIYEEIKQAGSSLEPKAVIRLIEYFQSDGELSRLLQLFKELKDHDYWVDGCCRIILYCVRYKHLSYAVDLLKQLKDKFCNDELALEVLFDEVFSLIGESESTHLQIGLDLLRVIKDELCVPPSRKCLDFLLSACVNAKDLRSSLLVWKEYQAAGLPYNVLSFLRMYQALLASGDNKSAKIMLNKIPKDDHHVRCVIKASERSYIVSNSNGCMKKKKKKGKT
ncbi:pentatricopeptide repeat-containing protein At4g04790, mitochondrial-like isoform X2 [Alnus glutinosa]|uniref:pentatricopeptide repeat-containing protein At4g04790, mitochondrial-like isoform X2 n=1 Tax=Alnus glutinosa TaxID=3517 RepID=UPI002D7890CA|nr:pentatricopeptide repeat-containing protein At4g04790, mitochondrial-like isoform X2 [Alnus glutinosa]